MNHQARITRWVLGIVFLVIGLNVFFRYISSPFFTDPAMKFLKALEDTGYFFPFVGALEVLCGLFLLADLYVPLVLVLLTPILFNVLLFHLFLAPGLIYFPLLVTGLHLYLALVVKPYSSVILRLFQANGMELKPEKNDHKKRLRPSVG